MKTGETPQPLREAPAAVAQAFTRLNPKQKAFALALPTAASQVEAAKKAGYSERMAEKQAFVVAANPYVKVVVDYLTAATVGKELGEARDSLERQLQELCHIGLADPRRMYDDNGNILPIKDWPDDIARAISSIETNEIWAGSGEDRQAIGLTRKVRFHAKIAAIDQVSKIKGYHRPQQVEHKHSGLGSILAEINGAETGPGPAR